MLQSAADYYRKQRALSALAVRAARKAATTVDAAAQIAAYQMASATLAESSADLMLSEQGIDTTAVGSLNPTAFASNGASLTDMIEGLVDNTALDRLVSTLVSDAGRSGMGVAAAVRPAVTGHVRYLSPPSCSRCAVLAGRFYRWSSGFLRHPHCDCQMVPSNGHAAPGLTTDPIEAFKAGQVRGLSQADAQAIRDGADFGRVVNVRSSTAGLRPSSVITRGDKLTPEGIYRVAAGRDEAIALLGKQGYITAGRPAHATSMAAARIEGDLSALGEATAADVAQRWAELTTRFPEVPGTLQITRQASSRSGVTSGRAIALRTDNGFEIGGIELSPRIGLESAERAFQKAVENGWFTAAPSNAAHTLTHEFGHLLDYFTGMKVSVGRAQRRAWTAAGIKPGSDVDLFIKRNTSGYARTERAEAVAEAFADVVLNGVAASPINRAIFEDLMRLYKKRVAELT